MNYVSHTVSLRGTEPYGRRAPSSVIGNALKVIPLAIDRSVRMAFQGTSASRGRRPAWLDAASDVRFVDYGGDGETVLTFEAPTFGKAAEELYRQQELWPSRPSPEDTGFDVFGDVLSDVWHENADSDRFDAQLLKEIKQFSKVLNGTFQEMRLAGHRLSHEANAVISPHLIEVADRLRCTTPSPERVRLVGTLDMIRASTHSFAVKLESGQEVRGVLTEGDPQMLRDFFDHKVLVLGRMVFRPSGRLLRIDAEQVSLAGHESSIWSQLPQTAGRSGLNATSLHRPQGPRSGVAAILGKWPGDESDEEVSEALKNVS